MIADIVATIYGITLCLAVDTATPLVVAQLPLVVAQAQYDQRCAVEAIGHKADVSLTTEVLLLMVV